MPFLSSRVDAAKSEGGPFRRETDSLLALARDRYTPSLGGQAIGDGTDAGTGVHAGMRDAAFLQDALKKGCANPDCRERRAISWRSRRQLTFEGKLGCKGACIDTLIRAAIAREGSAGRASSEVVAPHRHRVPLGLVMLAHGWITHPQLQKALEAQRAGGEGRIGDWLASECGLDPGYITRAVGVQWNCPVLTTDGFSPQAMAMVLPRLFVKDCGMLPLRIAVNKILYLGFRDRPDASLAFAAERISGLQVVTGIVAEKEFEPARQRLLECSFPSAYGKLVTDSDALATQMAIVLEQKQAVAAKMVRLHQHYWMRVWTNAGAKPGLGSPGRRLEDISDFLFTIGAQA